MNIESKLEDTLSRLMTECRKLAYTQPSNVDMLPVLTLFLKLLGRSSDTQLYYFKEKFQGELQRMKPIIAKYDRSLHDKIYKKLNLSRYTSHATAIFEEFIKGITFFENEKEEKAVPIYHRLYACGPYADTHRQGNLICTSDLSKDELKRRRPLIERCYVERLIYDEIYKYYTPTQDEGHLFRMKLTREDFESCFPDTEITVQVEHEDNAPVKAIIIRTHKGAMTKIIYQKYMTLSPMFGVKIYQENVEVEKTDEKGRIFLKTSRFANPGKFVAS
jgi:hypothetical protein